MIELDESEGTLSSNYEDITKELKDLKERKANNSRVHVNYSLDSMIILNDLRRLQALKEGKPADAVRIARENYDKKVNTKEERNLIAMQVFALYIHVTKGMDMQTQFNVQTDALCI